AIRNGPTRRSGAGPAALESGVETEADWRPTPMPIAPSPTTSPNPPVEVAGSRFTAALYNPFTWLRERLVMAARRRNLMAPAEGPVLEIGAGTGLNLRRYPAGLEGLILVEPGEAMADRVDLSQAPPDVPVTLLRAPAEYLPFDDDSFDTVVSTLVLCTVS